LTPYPLSCLRRRGYLLFHLLDKAVALLKGGQKGPDLKGQTDSPFWDADRAIVPGYVQVFPG
jgi:hypothetical protein